MKIMKRNVIGFFIYILYVAGVKSNSSTKSITQKIKEDTCSTASYVYNSNYTNACRSLTYHSSSIELLKNSTDEFLCLAVFDLSYKICYLDSMSKLQYYKMNLTNNVTIFYDELRLLSAKPQLAEHLCKFLQKEHLFVSHDNIESKVSQLNAVLKDSNKCFRICTDFKENVNPLCIILAWADKILTNYDALIKIEVKEQELNISSISNVEVDRTKNIVLPGTKKQESQLINANGSTEPGADKASPSSNENVPRDLIRGNTSKLISNNGRLNNEASSVNKNTPIKPSTVHTLSASITKQEENTAVKPPSISNSMNNGIDNKGTHLTSNLSSDQSTLHELTQQKGTDRVKEKKFENDINKYSDNISLHQGNLSQFLLTDTNVKTLKLNTILDNSHDHEDTFNEENYDHQDNISPYDLKEGTDLANDIDDNANQQLPDYSKQRESSPRSNRIRHEDESHFFTYLMILSLLCIGGYVGYHNKQKILAIVLEGRRSRSSRNRRRPSTASYRKLDCTLEEAVTSQCNSNVTHVIY